MEHKRTEEQEIDLIEILQKIIAIKKKLLKAAVAGAAVAMIVSFSIPKEYTVNVTLSPEVGSLRSLNGSASNGTSYWGESAGNVIPDALNVSIAPDIVSSTPFLLELLESGVVIQDGETHITLSSYLEELKSPWWGYVKRTPGMLISGVKSLFAADTKEETGDAVRKGVISLNGTDAAKIGTLRRLITASIDKKTEMTSISVTLQDPYVTATIADSVISKLQHYITTYRTTKAKESCKYLEMLYKEKQKEYYDAQQCYARYVDANSNVIFQGSLAERERLQNDMNLAYQVYSQVARQLQVARAKVQEEKPVFAVVEPAVVPLHASKPNRKIIIAGFVFLAVVCTCGWEIFGKELVRQISDF